MPTAKKTAKKKSKARKMTRRHVPSKPARRARPDAAVLTDIDSATMAGQGLSRANFTDQQIAVLTAPFTENELEILEDGSVYVPQVHIRKRLSKVFRVGQWGVEVGKPETVDDRPVIRIRLYVNGAPVGECYADRDHGLESAKSQGIVRCCKDLDMAADCWDRRWSYAFRLQWGVFVETEGGGSEWRNSLSPPLANETGIDPRSPNKRRYKAPTIIQRASSGARPSRTSRTADRQKVDALRHETAEPSDLGEDPGRLIGTPGIKKLMAAARTHGRTDAIIKGYIRTKWKHTSKKQIQLGQFKELMEWVQAPEKPKKRKQKRRAK